MAKRKRLTPANPVFLEPAPEQKTMISAPPIADVAREAAASAAAAELAQTLTSARENGRMVVTVPLEQIQLDYLVRDRVAVEGDDMQALMDSLRQRGQQTPIELVELAQGRYGLISGWRRCTALAALHADTGEAQFAEVLALLRRPADSAEAYQAMVEENEIRVGLSYYERARITCKAVEQGVFDDRRSALRALFASASRPRRSKIGSFVTIVEALDGTLQFPQMLGERLGLSLARALTDDPDMAARLVSALNAAERPSYEAEQAVIETVLQSNTPSPIKPSPKPEAQSSAKADPAPGPTPDKGRPVVGGVNLRLDGNRLTLEGRMVDEALEAKLTAWLRQTF